MSQTFQLQLLQAVLATQQHLQVIQADHVHLDRTAPLADEDCNAINVAPGEAKFEVFGSEGDYDTLRCRMQFVLAHHTRGDPQTALADPAMAESHQALMADPSLGGLALRLSLIGTRPRKASANGTVGIYELTYEATVLVNERTLEIWAHSA